jgi:hypothetical protein
MFQMIDHWKVPHHQGRNFPLRHILFIKISFVINNLKTDSSLILVFYLFLPSVGIHMIVTSLVSTHPTYRTLRIELILFVVPNTMVGTCVYFSLCKCLWAMCLTLEVILLEDSKVLRNYCWTIHGRPSTLEVPARHATE